MALQGVFNADFTAFTNACAAAEASLKGFETGASKTESALNRMADSISGQKIVQQAMLATKAVEDIGGAAMLTEKELARMSAIAGEGAEKLQKMGQTVPADMQRLADATKTAADQGGQLTSVLGGIAGQLAGMFTVGALIGFGREVLAVGDQVQKMADQTGLSTEQVQKLQYVAGQSGSSMEALVSASQNLTLRLGDDSSGAAGALKRLNINVEDFKRLNPYDQMIAVAEAVQSIKDPTEQASTAAAFFGKTWKEILPAIKSGMAEVADQAPIMADATIKSLDRVGDALGRAKAIGVTWGGAVVLAFEQAGFAVGDFLSKFDPAHFGVANSELLAMVSHLNDPDGLRGAFAKIPPVALAVGDAFHGVAMSAEEVNRIEKELTTTANESIAAQRKQADEMIAVRKVIQQIETDHVKAAETNYLGLSKLQNDVFQQEIEGKGKAATQVMAIEQRLTDEYKRQSMDRSTYENLKLWESAEAQIAAFKKTEATAAQVTAFSNALYEETAIKAAELGQTASNTLDQVTTKAAGALSAIQMAIQQVSAGLPVDLTGNALAAGGGGPLGMQAPIYVSPGPYGTPVYGNQAPVVGGSLPRFADGVNNFGGGLAIVGERGPELVNLPGGSDVIPNGRGGGVTQIFNISHPLGTPEAIARAVAEAQVGLLRNQGVRLPYGT